ncbi:hypothetical protein [Streptomyces sp. NPDC047453]|uniref:hypothetical protein n=1 Tax=Streptomyces sp. NPDC047453 TaxID=3154812 RepID=UPI0033E280B7
MSRARRYAAEGFAVDAIDAPNHGDALRTRSWSYRGHNAGIPLIAAEPRIRAAHKTAVRAGVVQESQSL